MPHLKFTPEAQNDLKRFADFLVDNGARDQAKEVVTTIIHATKLLRTNPLIGRMYQIATESHYRELVIRYGRGGYVALYSFDDDEDLVVIHAIRHQRELGYVTES